MTSNVSNFLLTVLYLSAYTSGALKLDDNTNITNSVNSLNVETTISNSSDSSSAATISDSSSSSVCYAGGTSSLIFDLNSAITLDSASYDAGVSGWTSLNKATSFVNTGLEPPTYEGTNIHFSGNSIFKVQDPQTLKSSVTTSRFSLHFGLEPHLPSDSTSSNIPQQLFSYTLPSGSGFSVLLSSPISSLAGIDEVTISIADLPVSPSISPTVYASATSCRSKIHTSIFAIDFDVAGVNSTTHLVDFFKDGSRITQSLSIPVSSNAGQAISEGSSSTSAEYCNGGTIEIGCTSAIQSGVTASGTAATVQCLTDRLSSFAILKEGSKDASIRQYATTELDARGISAVCGDGNLLVGDEYNEECDDGNVSGGDGCSCDCSKECSDVVPSLTSRHLSVVAGVSSGYAPGAFRDVACEDKGLPVSTSLSADSTERISCLTGGSWALPTLVCAPACGVFGNSTADDSFEEIAWRYVNVTSPPSPITSSSGATLYRDGSAATVGCNQGYADRGDRTEDSITCTNGKWTLPSLVCEPSCSEIPSLPPSVQVKSDSKAAAISGGSITLECNTLRGFQPSSTSDVETTLICSNGAWQGVLPVCLSSCPVVKMPLGVELTGNALLASQEKTLTSLESKAVSQSATEQKAAAKNTASGTSLDSPAAANITSVSSAPPSTANTTSSDYSDAPVSESSSTANNQTVSSAATSQAATVIVNTNSTLIDPTDGEFQGVATLSQSQRSHRMQRLASSFVQIRSSGYVTHGTTVQVRCSSGYSSSSSSSTNSTATSVSMSCNNGQWQGGEELKCVEECPPFSPPGFSAAYVISDASDDAEGRSGSREHGATRTLSCADGYASINEDLDTETVTCVNGNWQTPMLRCFQACSSPPADASLAPYIWTAPSVLALKAANSNTTSSATANSPATHGQSGQLSCASGYSPSGALETQSLTCLNGSWTSRAIECKRDCSSTPLDLLSVRPHASLVYKTGVAVAPASSPTTRASRLYQHGASYAISCSNSTSSIGRDNEETIFCVDGEWQTPSVLSCKKSCASDPPESANSTLSVVGDGLVHGSTRRVSCKAEYAVSSGVSETESVISCLDGSWTSSFIRCEPGCGSFPSLDSDSYLVTSNSTSTALGDARTVSCVANPDTSQVVTCRASTVAGASAAWEPLTITCGASCTSPTLKSSLSLSSETSASFQTVSNSTDSISYAAGSQLFVKCADGFTATSGVSPSPLVCTSAGRWTEATLTCQQSCSAAPILPRGVAITDTHGGSVGGGALRTVACAQGYADSTLVNSETIICSSTTGSWTDVALKCEPVCVNPNSVEDFANQLVFETADMSPTDGLFRTGATVHVSCNTDNNYAAQIGSKTAGSLVCLTGGIWSLPDIVCGLRCSSPTLFIDQNKYNSTYLIGSHDSDDLVATADATSSGYHEGTIRVVSCSTGYANKFVAAGNRGISVCAAGAWSSLPALNCVPVCASAPDAASSDMYAATKAYSSGLYPHGTAFSIGCNSTSGWYSDAAQSYEDLICLEGTWTSPTLKCLQSCPLFNIANIGLTNSDSYTITDASFNLTAIQQQVSSRPAVGADWVEISCSDGYSSGQEFNSEVIRCSAAATSFAVAWEPVTLACKRSCESFPEPAASIIAVVSPPYQGQSSSSHGSTASLKCASGFTPSANTVSEEVLHCYDGEWETSSIECYASAAPVTSSSSSSLIQSHMKTQRRVHSLADAPQSGESLTDLLALHNLVLINATTTGDELNSEHGATVDVQCAAGYSSIWQSSRTQETLVSNEGVWTSPTLVCSLNCQPLSLDANLYVQSGAGALSYGTSVEVTCAANAYPALSGDALRARRQVYEQALLAAAATNSTVDATFDEHALSETVTCGPNGIWTPLTIRCERQCSPLKLVANYSAIIVPDSSESMVSPRDSYTVACNEKDGYTAVSQDKTSVVTCIDGTWTSSVGIECRQQCATASLPSPLIDFSSLYILSMSSASSANKVTTEMSTSTEQLASFNATDPVQSLSFQPHGTKLRVQCDPLVSAPSVGAELDNVSCRDGVWTMLNIECVAHCPELSLPTWADIKSIISANAANSTSNSTSASVSVDADGSSTQSSSDEAIDTIDADDVSIYSSTSDSSSSSSTASSSKLVLIQSHSRLRISSSLMQRLGISASTPSLDGLSTMRVLTKTAAPRLASAPTATHPYIMRSHGASRQISCDEDAGFFPKVIDTSGNFGASISEELICSKSEWSKPKLQCEPGCSAFTLPSDIPAANSARYTIGNSAPELVRTLTSGLKLFAPGSILNISCADGWAVSVVGASPNQNIICSSGSWSPMLLRCVPKMIAAYTADSRLVGAGLGTSNSTTATSAQNVAAGASDSGKAFMAWRSRPTPGTLSLGDVGIYGSYSSPSSVLVLGGPLVATAETNLEEVIGTNDLQNVHISVAPLKVSSAGAADSSIDNYICVGDAFSAALKENVEGLGCIHESCVEDCNSNSDTVSDACDSTFVDALGQKTMIWQEGTTGGEQTSLWAGGQWFLFHAVDLPSRVSEIADILKKRVKWECVEKCPGLGWHASREVQSYIQNWSNGVCICDDSGCADIDERNLAAAQNSTAVVS